MEVEEKEGTLAIPVMHEFEDVFLEEVPMAPYCMASAELVELKKQIEEFLGK